MKRFDVTYDIKDNHRKILPLVKSGDLLIVRMKAGKEFSDTMDKIIKDEPLHYNLLFNISNVNVYVVRVEGEENVINELREKLSTDRDVRFAGFGFRNEQTAEPIVYTENIFIKFKNDIKKTQCEYIINKYNLIIKNEISFLKNAYFISAIEDTGDDIFTLAEDILNCEEVEYCHPELIHQKMPKAIHPNQWHLKKTTVRTETDVDASANVEAAHEITRGAGITIAIIDDGFDIQHPEFMRPGKVVHPHNYEMGYENENPLPDKSNRHGTACAGVACADGLYGASGVAPEANLMPIRLVDGLGSMGEALAFVWAADKGADIISCSWGPADGIWFDPDDEYHDRETELPALTRLAIDYAVEKGRNGKGCAVFFAAGNGNESVDNNGYASNDKVIAVGACNDRSTRCAYSDFGKALWCTFPSGDFAHPEKFHPAPLTSGIWTTDVRNQDGYNTGMTLTGDLFGNYTNKFGGTSSSCPGAAGVAALILSVNPSLTYLEVRDIIRDSCDKIDRKNGKYDKNGHSKWYGYGRVNAEKAVLLAKCRQEEVRDVL
ncbi:peptidase S8 [Yersinia entomophaga]|uniref:Peptidase S8 n=1 Tax=Yersinia entomophaga TaxID=935293 RepID=A0ABN4Q3Q3_YERET|nr:MULTISPECIES: S8 family serine peptidase [Yersinia]ANI31620.1 peptidase S8 [Yersinia entomophaga]OWF86527.1 peptidase S8 [Yersinia entomophaga]